MKQPPIFASNRLFEVWRYTVSHRQLLVRSNRGSLLETRLEVLFKDVAFMAILPVMKGMTITELDPAIDELPLSVMSIGIRRPWYRIESEGVVGYVAAGAILTNEDGLGYDGPSGLLLGPAL